MPYIAVVHIPDDHTADAIVSREINVSQWGNGVRIVGLFDYPALPELTCAGCAGRKGKMISWVRDPRGYMKCNGCGSRNRNVRRWFTAALFDWFGANRIGDRAPRVFRTPEGYGERATD